MKKIIGLFYAMAKFQNIYQIYKLIWTYKWQKFLEIISTNVY